MEHRANMQLGKKGAKTRVFRWFGRFCDGREDLADAMTALFCSKGIVHSEFIPKGVRI